MLQSLFVNTRWNSRALLGGALLLAVIVAYLPATRAGFIWDDDSYITGNATLRSVDGLRRIWFEPGATTQYYPAVHTLFWLEYRVWGVAPAGYHWINILLHGANAALLFLLLRRLGVPGALFAASIFALHPVHVESVAWITEGKNTLSGFFYLASFLAYLRHIRERRAVTYAVAFALFLLALLSKTVTASLPAAIGIALLWRDGRVEKRVIMELLPFFLAGILAGAGTAWIEKHYLGAGGEEWTLSFMQRLAVAGRALWFYAGKLAWPARLTFIYPRWETDALGGTALLYPAAALAVGVLLWRFRRPLGTGPLAAVLFFGGTLAPALGFIDVYPFRFSFVADHFQYLASIGLIVLFAASLASWTRRIPLRRTTAAALLLCALLGTLTWRQCGVYTDLETLWSDTIEKNDRCWMAFNNLGQLLAARGETKRAIGLYRKAIEVKPDYDKALNNLGVALDATGRRREAVALYERVLAANGENVVALNNLVMALTGLGRYDEAIRRAVEGLRIRPGSVELTTNLGVALARKGDFDGAVSALRRAVSLTPRDAQVHYRLATLLEQGNLRHEAISEYRETLRIDRFHAGAREGIARLADQGRPDPADEP